MHINVSGSWFRADTFYFLLMGYIIKFLLYFDTISVKTYSGYIEVIKMYYWICSNDEANNVLTKQINYEI